MYSLILLLSDVVSLITVVLCFILKVPQIACLFKAKSSAGLSLNALIIELLSYTTTMMYNYTNNHAIFTYMEYPILLIQDYIIIGLVMRFSNYRLSTFLGIILLNCVICWAFASGLLSKVILQLLVPCTVPAGVLSKGMQFLEIVRKKNAYSVSTVTWSLSVFTNVTRIFTVYVDSMDTILLCNFTISSLCSTSVLLAALYYQRLTKFQEKKK